MPRIRTLVIGGAVGAALTYFLDGELGPARRAQLKELVGAAINRGRYELNRQTRQPEARRPATWSSCRLAVRPGPRTT